MRDVAAIEIEKRDVPIVVGGQGTLRCLPLRLADHLGYLKDEGLEVEINGFHRDSRSLQALIGGSADVAASAFHRIL